MYTFASLCGVLLVCLLLGEQVELNILQGFA